MTSIELLENKINDLIYKDSDLYAELQIAIEEAKEIYKHEMGGNEISENEIIKESNRYCFAEARFSFIKGANWYKEKLKNKI
jgi:hypothetical protein